MPEMAQSLNVLALPLLDIKGLIAQELEDNPFLEELPRKEKPLKYDNLPPSFTTPDFDLKASQMTKKTSLQDMLLRQLGMFTNNDLEFKIGQEIIGNIDENGYFKASIEEISGTLKTPIDKVKKVLKIIQDFDPTGIGARNISECLLIQLKNLNETDPLLFKIVESHLDDVARKNYSHIAKVLKEPQEKIEPLIKKILKLDPKPGRNYSSDEVRQITPDVVICEKDDEDAMEAVINNEDLPTLAINKTYRKMLKDETCDPATKEFLALKFQTALELLRAISRRQTTLRKIVDAILEMQPEAVKNGLSCLKPMTFSQVAEKINMHESTVCRAVMNKYIKVPYGIVALKDFFTSHVHGNDGSLISCAHVKGLIKELIANENKKHPLSDQDIFHILTKENNMNVSRRTIAKYREELKILSTTFRRER